MRCLQCGNNLTASSKFCGNCGSKASTNIAEATHLESTTRKAPNVRTLFVLGNNQTQASIDWLTCKYPFSKVQRYVSVGAVRELAVRMHRSGLIDSICLIGTATTVPTDRLFDDGFTQRASTDESYNYYVESDFLYGTQAFSIDALPDPSNIDESLLQRQLIRTIGIEQLSDMVPVGRIPFDNFTDWKSYLESLDNDLSHAEIDWVALTADEQDWRWECEVIFDWLSVNASVYGVPPDEEYKEFIERLFLRDHSGATVKRILINGHGAQPNDSDQQSFYFYSDNTAEQGDRPFSNDFSDLVNCEGDALFLFACHGGDSGWWNKGLLGHFLSNGGRVAIAASSNVYCTQPTAQEQHEVPPGALQVCAEFWAAVDSAQTVAAALIYAKQKVLLDALERHPAFFARCLKEVLHFSLYGAPWVLLSNTENRNKFLKPATPISATQPKPSLLEQVRTGQFRNAIGPGQDRILNDIRQRLRTSLGSDAAFFSLKADQVLTSYRKTGALNQLSHTLSSVGLDITKASFQSLQLGKRQYHLAEIPTLSGKRSGALVVMDDQGTLIEKYHLKECKGYER